MTLAVVAWASGECPILRASSAKHGVPLTVYPTKDGQYAESLDTVQAIRGRSEGYIVITDAFDVFVSRWDSDEVISLIDAEPSGIILSCEISCYPPGPWCEVAYPAPQSIWAAVNGGQMCGRRDALADLMERNICDYQTTAGGGNQERYHKMLAAGVKFGLDTDCRVFCSMAGHSLVENRDGLAYNTVTGTNPMFLHFNGRTPGIEEWYERVYGAAS